MQCIIMEKHSNVANSKFVVELKDQIGQTMEIPNFRSDQHILLKILDDNKCELPDVGTGCGLGDVN